MNLMNVKKVLALAAVAVSSVCLIPEAAHAQLLRYSGTSNSNTYVEFLLDTSFTDSTPPDDLGVYSGAIQDFGIFDDNDRDQRIFPELAIGTLRTSRLNIDDLKEFELTKDDLLNDLTEAGIDVKEFVTFEKYEITFSDPNFEATLFVPTRNNDLIESLSGNLAFVELLPQIQGVVRRPFDANFDSPDERGQNGVFDLFGLDSGSSFFTVELVQDIPEPSATSGLVGIGALGVVLLLNRNKRLRKQLVSLNKSQNI